MGAFSLENEPWTMRGGRGPCLESPGMTRPSCTLSLSQERIPYFTSYLDGWQHLSNPQVPWGTEAAKSSLRTTVFPPIFCGIGNIRIAKKNPTWDFLSHALGYLVPWILCCCCRISHQNPSLWSLRLLQEPRAGCFRCPSSHQAGPKKKIECKHSSKIQLGRKSLSPTAEGASLTCLKIHFTRNLLHPWFMPATVFRAGRDEMNMAEPGPQETVAVKGDCGDT